MKLHKILKVKSYPCLWLKHVLDWNKYLNLNNTHNISWMQIVEWNFMNWFSISSSPIFLAKLLINVIIFFMALVRISWWQPDWVQKSQVKYGALDQTTIIKRKLPSEWFNHRYVLTQNYCPWSVNLIIESAAGNPGIPLKLQILRASEMPPLLRWTGSNNGIIGFISMGIHNQNI